MSKSECALEKFQKTTIANMKFLVFLLIASTCLMAAKANIIVNSAELDDYKYEANDVAKEGIVEAEPYLLTWATLNVVIRKTVAIILGVKCTVREVREIREAAEKFINEIENCGEGVSDSVKTLVETCKKIVSISNDILHVKTNICGLSDEPEDTDENETPRKCFKKMYKTTVQLKDEVKKALDLIKVVTNAGKCAATSVKNLESVLIKFPVKIEFCSKLILA